MRRQIIEGLTPNLHVTYATSDFGSIATAGPAHHASDENVVGAIHPGVDLEIVDDRDLPMPAGQAGLIRVRSGGMATGDSDDAEATARFFRDGWFYPGDVGRLNEDGLLVFEGRGDDMINLAGINIYPAEVERLIEELPGVVECAMFALKTENFGDVPLVAVVADRTLTADGILKYAKERLGLRAPRRVFLIDELPRNGAGKIVRDRLHAIVGLPALKGAVE